MNQLISIYSTLLIIQRFLSSCHCSFTPGPISEVIDSEADIESLGWEVDGVLFANDKDGLPPYKPGGMDGLTGTGLWYWHNNGGASDNPEVHFNTGPDTYKNMESVTLNIHYYLVYPASSSSFAQIQPVKCSEPNCSPYFTFPRSTVGNIWSIATVEIDVQALPVSQHHIAVDNSIRMTAIIPSSYVKFAVMILYQ